MSWGLDSIDARYGIEDDLLVLTRVIQDWICEKDPAEIDQGPFLRPVNRRVLHDIVVVCHLHQNLKAYRASRNSFCELVKEIVCTSDLGSRVIQVFDPRVRLDAVPPIAAHTVLVGKAQRCHAEV